MAEYLFEQTKALANLFAKEYNLTNKASFVWDEKKSYQPRSRADFDFLLFDGRKELGCQLTRAVADKEREFIRWSKVDPVIKELERLLTINPKIPRLSLFFNFYNVPQNKNEVKELVFWLEFFITHKVQNSLRLAYFTHDADFDDEYLLVIKKYIDDIDIAPNKDREKKVITGWSVSKKGVEAWPAEDIKLVAAVSAKEAKYRKCGDIVLLIDPGMFSVGEYYVEEAKKQLAEAKFKEIWLVENFVGREKAVKLK